MHRVLCFFFQRKIEYSIISYFIYKKELKFFHKQIITFSMIIFWCSYGHMNRYLVIHRKKSFKKIKIINIELNVNDFLLQIELVIILSGYTIQQIIFFLSHKFCLLFDHNEAIQFFYNTTGNVRGFDPIHSGDI